MNLHYIVKLPIDFHYNNTLFTVQYDSQYKTYKKIGQFLFLALTHTEKFRMISNLTL